MALYRAIVACIVLGMIIALAVACAVAVIAVVSAVIYGLASRTRTVGSALQSLAGNGAAAVELIGSLRPQAPHRSVPPPRRSRKRA